MSAPLVLAVPAKGRLAGKRGSVFRARRLTLVKPRGARDYRGTIAGLDGRRSRLSVRVRNHRQLARRAPSTSASPARIWCAR